MAKHKRGKLENVDRGNWEGFKKYWIENPYHFHTLFGEQTLEEAYKSITEPKGDEHETIQTRRIGRADGRPNVTIWRYRGGQECDSHPDRT